MIRRTTLSADAADLSILRADARRRGVSLAIVLREVVADAAARRRATLPKPHMGVFSSNGSITAQDSVDDEDSPARGRLSS